MGDSIVLELLRAIRTDIGEIKADIVEIKERLGILEASYSSSSRRVDRIAGDVVTIKRRLDIADAWIKDLTMALQLRLVCKSGPTIPSIQIKDTVVAEISLEMLQTLINKNLEGQLVIRRELSEMRTLLLAVVDQGRRTERRVSELRDDIELMVKSELMGRLGHFETQIESKLDELEARITQ